MSWQNSKILNLEGALGAPESFDEVKSSQLLLEWIVDNAFFRSEVFENDLEISGQKYFRFSIKSTDQGNNQYHGIGRSKNRLHAASIAAGEVVERFVVKKILKSADSFSTSHIVNISNGEISVTTSTETDSLPSPGFHSSNGWAVHFSLNQAVEKSVIEALERHTLLYSYLHSGWNGFHADKMVPFNGHRLNPYISKFSFGGFSAGLVATTGEKFPGQTFGYLCDEAKQLGGSPKWLNAFFESFDQWESLSSDNKLPADANFLIKYQRHFLTTPVLRQEVGQQNADIENISDIRAHIFLLDLKTALDLPISLFAAFTFGGNLIPLFFKQKLTPSETVHLSKILKDWQLPAELPEVHPVL